MKLCKAPSLADCTNALLFVRTLAEGLLPNVTFVQLPRGRVGIMISECLRDLSIEGSEDDLDTYVAK